MKYSDEIEKYILDCDGSTRDITFTPIPLNSLLEFLGIILNIFEPASISDNEGDSIDTNFQAIQRALLLPSGYIHGTFTSDKAAVTSIDIFIDWDEKGEFAVELSFFPRNINLKCYSLQSFMSQVEEWWKILGSKTVFIRYENASWSLYDKEGLGVFFYCENV